MLPNGWCFSTLGEVFTLQAGKNITAKDIKDTATELHPYKCYGGNGVRGFVALYNREGNFPIIGRQGALCGNINIAKEKFYATEHAVVVERYCDVDLMWAYYMLTALNLNQYATATAQPGLSVTVINDVCISLPPRKEQERISKEIGHWFALLDQIEQGKADLQTTIKLTKSKILDLAIHGKLVPQDPNDEPAIELLKRMNPDFTPCDNGHYTNLPKGWAICKLSDLCRIENGFAFSSNDYKSQGIPLVRISNITHNTIDITDCVYVEGITDNKFKISKGDLLIAMSGATTGKMGVYLFDEIAYLNQRVGNIKILNKSSLFPDYRNIYMQSKVDEILKIAYGGAQPNISASVIGNFDFPLPPYKEQIRIVETVQRIFDQLDTITESL